MKLKKGNQAVSVLMSFVQTCRAMDINPHVYLEDIFKQLATLPNEKLIERLPDRWRKNQSKKRISHYFPT